ncbi:hypothetical protein [Butyrivibrio sp. AD3002]|uniref:hypothetical protein n=1 Tax=Butyrivibrio sp. AD3002 TaxID=1280670 RepID=UPI0003B2F202|nr:hypothetical protein [Butyrivibrio sp. AD3002]
MEQQVKKWFHWMSCGDKHSSFLGYFVEGLAWTVFIAALTKIFIPVTGLRLRLWIWKIIVVIILIALLAGLIMLIFSIKKNLLRVLAIALTGMLLIGGGEILMLSGMLFFTQTEEVITRDGEKYVMEVEQFDDTYVRFYPYKNLFFSGPIRIKESYAGDASITYYDKHGFVTVSRSCMSNESYEELWYYKNRMDYY